MNEGLGWRVSGVRKTIPHPEPSRSGEPKYVLRDAPHGAPQDEEIIFRFSNTDRATLHRHSDRRAQAAKRAIDEHHIAAMRAGDVARDR